jgi:serine/threonine protein kinase
MQSFQQQEFFCQECGAANSQDAQVCVACQRPLGPVEDQALSPAPVSPVVAAPAIILAGSRTLASQVGPETLLHGRYRVMKQIGRGGFGAVYRARDRQRRNRLVAIKEIDLSRLSPRQIIEATDTFNREVAMLSRLKHRSLPKIVEHFTENNCWYLVMEYIQGQTLEELLKRSRAGYFSLAKSIRIGQKLVEVLDYLHSNKPSIIFRDVKPANIMLTRFGRVYLIDFGIARNFSPWKIRDTGALGSPGYAAPEQYGRAQTDERTDIYGLGATLQTLLIGRDPLELSLGEQPRNPRPLPLGLQALLASMMEADPRKRPPHVLGLGSQLEKSVSARYALITFGQGLAFGAIFVLLSYLGVYLSLQLRANQIGSSQIQALILWLNCLLPLAGTGAAIWQIVNLVKGHKRWFAIAALLMLFIAFCLTVTMSFLLAKWGMML